MRPGYGSLSTYTTIKYTQSTVVSVEEPSKNRPHGFRLFQNYPNPFNPATQIEYAVPVATRVKLIIYNLLGQRVRLLVDKKQAAGLHRVSWDGTDDSGRRVASGVYVYRLHASSFLQSRKLVLLQ